MIDNIFALMQLKPVLSLILIFALIVVILFLFKDTIVDYIKKKYDLHSKEEIVEALNKAADERVFFSKTTDKLTPEVQERVMKFLDTK